MSEITFETGEIPICVDCQIKHAVDLKAHTEPGSERREKVAEVVEDIRRDLTMTPEQLQEYEKIRAVEHKIEDYLTVLRDMRHDLEEQTLPEELKPGNPEPPRIGKLLEACSFEKEVVKPKEHFDPASFRTLCPECPEGRCAYCPPELACATRIIIGCPSEHFKGGVCQVGTQKHVIYHGEPKP